MGSETPVGRSALRPTGVISGLDLMAAMPAHDPVRTGKCVEQRRSIVGWWDSSGDSACMKRETRALLRKEIVQR